ncbi:MAG: ribose-phosphate pyrophosphokinase [Caulobacter sp.]|nr:ribose-phosphate pyrophosphokinase [Caulobacter sp.]
MRLILPLPGAEALASEIAAGLDADLGAVETRRFPDGEAYVRLPTALAGRDVVIVCTLVRPDEQFLRLVFAARAARELGATRLTLVAPYLAYMRQDKRFQPGEALTSRHFAHLISREFDALVTVDPHLHRHKALSEIYSIPATALRAAPLLADWIRFNVERPLIIGPDAESEQWVSEVAELAAAPHLVLSKQRHGDRDVEIAISGLDGWRGYQPVLVDDIVSSGRTMIETAEGMIAKGLPKPVCVAVHALFADDAYLRLSERAGLVISTNTISHPSNGISVTPLLVDALVQVE